MTRGRSPAEALECGPWSEPSGALQPRLSGQNIPSGLSSVDEWPEAGQHPW